MNLHKVRGRGRGFYRNSRMLHSTSNSNPRDAENKTHTAQVQVKKNEANSHNNKNCCNGINMILDLDPQRFTFLTDLKNMWNMLKRSPPVINKLQQHFNSCENPFSESLILIYNCQEFNNAKSKSLPYFIIEELKSWAISFQSRTKSLLTSGLKIDAFKLISTQNSLGLTKLVVEVYEMAEDGSIFIDIINCMIENKKYKAACQSTSLLKLQDSFSVEEFLLPLILQDKLYGIDEFLLTSPRHQVELVTLLDSTLGKTSVRDAMASYVYKLNVPDVKWEKLHAKPIKKLITRLVKTFKLPNNIIPNLNKRRNEGALQFLIHKRYIEHSFGHESWKEMVQEAIGDDEDLQIELVVQVSIYGDIAEALRWALFYNIEKKHWPHNVKRFYENPEEERLLVENTLPDDDLWGSEEVQILETTEYHKFDLPFDNIRLINSEATFKDILKSGLQGIDVVGVDCEWKPNFCSQKNELALMQISTRREVFIIDVISLASKVPHLWQDIGRLLFNNCDIIKLGFGFTSDMVMIRQSIPELNFTSKQVGFLDLLSLWKILEKFPKFKLPYDGQSSGPSLGTLVNQCFGHPLDKSEQFSNWEKRPLRHSQLVYAALDAYCLIQVYDVIKACAENVAFPFEETCYNLMTNEKITKKKTKKTVRKKQHCSQFDEEVPQPPSPHLDAVSVMSMKVVCDTMLQGLGKNLRRCGVDTAILSNDMDHMECVRLAQDDSRYILTKGNIYNKLSGYVPVGHCLKIISDNVDEQLKEFIDYYKVSVTKDDVFSVCQACNGRNFVQVPQSVIMTLRVAQTSCSYFPANYEIEAYDEATGFSSEEEYEFEPGPPINFGKREEPHSEDKNNVEQYQTRLGAQIQVDTIPEGIFDKVSFFYVCEDCGKVYWDGSHLERVLNGRLQGIVQ